MLPVPSDHWDPQSLAFNSIHAHETFLQTVELLRLRSTPRGLRVAFGTHSPQLATFQCCLVSAPFHFAL